MPKLGQSNIVELRLPSSTEDDPAIVKLDLNITGGQAEDLYDSDKKSGATFELIAQTIKEWNFTDADDKPVPITADNVRKLNVGDFKFISEQLFGLLGLQAEISAIPQDEKKG